MIKTKEQIEELLGKKVSIKINVGRNKYENYEGVLLAVYPYLFTVKVNNLVKSFTYVDLVTHDVQLKLKND